MAGCSTATLIVIFFSVVFPSIVSGQTRGRVVGGLATWNSPGFDYQAWADSTIFYIGDALVFEYDRGVHNVVVADSPESFDQCQMSPNLGVYDSGFDSLLMNDPGTYYFMCTFNCQDNMKFKVTPMY